MHAHDCNDVTDKLRAQNRADELHRLLDSWAVKYQLGTPQVTDEVYDAHMKELQALEATFPDVKRTWSPTQRVMAAAPDTGGIRHTAPMLSLENAHDEADLGRFLARVLASGDYPEGVPLELQPKVDGASVALRYAYGLLSIAVTRGDGSVGQDVTHVMRTIRDVPLRLAALEHVPMLEVRGEIYMSRATLERLNASGYDFANCRNAAVGAMGLSDVAEISRRTLSFMPYEVLAYKAGGVSPSCDLVLLQSMRAVWTAWWGRPYESMFPIARGNVRTAAELYGMLQEYNKVRPELRYDTDGAVVKLTDFAGRAALGSNNHSPLWACAFKYPPDVAETVLKSITVQVGRHNTLTPVAELEPVKLSGSTVSRASLHNFIMVKQLGLAPGDVVQVCKAAEIIPQVLRVSKASGNAPFEVPVACPFCNSPVAADTEEAVALRCTNQACPEAVVQRLAFAVSKPVLDLDSIGPASIRRMIEAGHLRHVEDFFLCGPLEWTSSGMTAATATGKFVQIAERKAQISPAKLLQAIGIRNVGKTASAALLAAWRDLRALLNGSVTDEQVHSTPDLLPVAATAFCQWRAGGEALLRLEGLVKAGCVMTLPEEEKAGTQLAKCVIVITGELSKDRPVFEALVRKHGGRTAGAVSGKTTHLLVGKEPGAKKIAKAMEKGLPMWSEADFWALIQ